VGLGESVCGPVDDSNGFPVNFGVGGADWATFRWTLRGPDHVAFVRPNDSGKSRNAVGFFSAFRLSFAGTSTLGVNGTHGDVVANGLFDAHIAMQNAKE
jgi:hypothetical protein